MSISIKSLAVYLIILFLVATASFILGMNYKENLQAAPIVIEKGSF